MEIFHDEKFYDAGERKQNKGFYTYLAKSLNNMEIVFLVHYDSVLERLIL